jgi:hypothetical protein
MVILPRDASGGIEPLLEILKSSLWLRQWVRRTTNPLLRLRPGLDRVVLWKKAEAFGGRCGSAPRAALALCLMFAKEANGWPNALPLIPI